MPTSTFFLPQKPFMPLGTLRHQLLFPSGKGPQGGAPEEDGLYALAQLR